MKQTDSESSGKPEKATSHERQYRLGQSQVPHRASQTAYYQLIEACKQKNLDSIRVILSKRPDLANQRDEHNRTLFHYAAILVDSNGNTATTPINHQSVEQFPDEQLDVSNKVASLDKLCIDCFNHLTDHCDTKLWWQQDLDGLSALHLAVISSNVPLVRHIIFEHPYSTKYPLVCTLDNELHSPLHWAVITNNLDCVKLLISYAGTTLAHEPDLNGATPLHYATQTRYYPKYRQQLKLMLKSFSRSSADQSGCSSTCKITSSDDATTASTLNDRSGDHYDKAQVQRDAFKGNQQLSLLTNDTVNHQRGLEVLEYLAKRPQINLECMDRDRRTPLLWAASSGNRDAILLLVSNGANATAADINRLGALHCAASHGYTDCLECLLNLASSSLPGGGAAGQLELLVNQPDNLNCTPLFYSVLSGNIDCVETLLERGAKQDWQDSKGRTAAHFAALKGQLNSLKLLNERGANLWLANKQGDLPLHYAIKSGRQQVARWLLEHSPYERAVNAINNFGRAPIHLAVIKDNAQMADYLIKCGANLNQLVKVRDKNLCAGAGRAFKPNHKKSNENDVITNSTTELNQFSSNSTMYHYETALDMAQNLNHRDCLHLLTDKQALTAAQVIRNRFNGSDQVTLPARRSSLFDLQTAENPSPIRFDTSSSNGSPNDVALNDTKVASVDLERPLKEIGSYSVKTNRERPLNESASQPLKSSQIPKLPTRPAPDALPQTDSTESSALSQNSLNSVRGSRFNNNNNNNNNNSSVPTKGSQEGYSSKRGVDLKNSHLPHLPAGHDGDAANHDQSAEHNPGRSSKPYKGGISYNNEHMNASIKCKLYKHEPRPIYSKQNHSFPLDSQQLNQFQSAQSAKQQQPLASSEGRQGSQQGRRASQEIITNVNVYTSPCPHCVFKRPCKDCRCITTSAELEPIGGQTGALADAGEYNNTDLEANEPIYSDETSDSNTSAESELDSERSIQTDHRLPVIGAKLIQFEPAASSNFSNRAISMRHLPPSQNHEQHLPVILSDQERSASGASNELSRDTVGDGIYIDADGPALNIARQQQLQANESSSASIEPCFDRFQRARAEHRSVDRYRQTARSPVADYIHGNAPLQCNNQTRSVSLNRHLEGAGDTNPQRASPRSHHQYQAHRQPSFSRVRAKVDSHRPSAIGEQQIRSKSMSMISNHSNSNGRISQQRQNQFNAGEEHGSRLSDSRCSSRHTTIINGLNRFNDSHDNDELATRVEKAIRKYRQEKTLFEELQNLKRNQIRSGRANEALLVKRLVEHFRKDTFNLIGLSFYNGPYTYKSYERYLYDQLRKLSQSNSAKLGSLVGDNNIDQTGLHQQSGINNLSSHEGRDYIDEDLRADLELRQLFREDDQFNELYDGAIIKAPKPDQASNQSANLHDDAVNSHYDEHQQAEREQIHSDRIVLIDTDDTDGANKLVYDVITPGDEELQQEASVASVASSSRRSSIDIEREKLLSCRSMLKDNDVEPIEDRAGSLTSSIITDALNNIPSRASSPKPTCSKQTGRDTENNADDLKEASDNDATTPTPSASGSRRRSVVNIGNKVEIIYHDVGIEIDAVPGESADSEADKPSIEGHRDAVVDNDQDEGNSSAEEVRSVGAGSELVGSKTSCSSSSAERLADVAEAEEDEHGRSEAELAAETEQQVTEIGLGDGDKMRNNSVESDSSKVGPSQSTNLSGPISERTDSNEVPLAIARRASSPTEVVLRTDLESNDDGLQLTNQPCSSGRSRRFSLHEKALIETDEDEASKKTVFNGYDLDELQRKRKISRSRPTISNEIEPDSNFNLEFRDGKNEDNIDEGPRNCRTISPATRRRKERSKYFKGNYTPRVPIEEVKRRWHEIKATEMLKKRDLETGTNRSSKRTLDMRSTGSQLASNSSLSLTKSQPNLENSNNLTRSNNDNLSNSNYVLLYEVNKNFAGTSISFNGVSGSHNGMTQNDTKVECKKSQSKPDKVEWCYGNVVKIVDVRTLKRTLSLPESLMYSNNLLKRLNILKL